MARWVVLLLISISVFIVTDAYYERDPTPYRDNDCLVGAPVGIGVDNGKTIPDGAFTASSVMSNIRSPYRGRLGETLGAWTAQIQNSDQYLQVDLQREYMITLLKTQGRQGTDEFVTEYALSFSNDKKSWRYYTNEFGIREMFLGNQDGDNVKDNSLKYPVIARYVRFHPIRWSTVISLRIEVVACPYNTVIAGMNGRGYVHYTLNPNTPSTVEDKIKFRFKTNRQDGVLLYGDGNQGDYISLELKGGSIYMHLDLGSTEKITGATTQLGGNMLDDSNWHDVIIRRNRSDVILVVDRMESKFKSNGEFFRLNLDKAIYLGGVPSFDLKGVTVKSNLDGCLENVVFNGLKMIRDAQNGNSNYQMVGASPLWSCQTTAPVPMTFTDYQSYAKLEVESKSVVKVKLQFRTHEESGVLVRYEMGSTNNYIEMSFDEQGHLTYHLDTGSQTITDLVRNIAPDAKTEGFSDGLWHVFSMELTTEKLNVTVDRNSKVSQRKLDFGTGKTYYLGGYELGFSFRGCMRNVEINASPVDLDSIPEMVNVKVGTCELIDRCTPNPCEHGGRCTQDYRTFQCDCTGTGYKGSVCHISSYYLSCEMYKMYTSFNGPETATIDIDGSGPLMPFEVQCNGKNEVGKPVETWVGHDSEELIRVDGYQAPDNYYSRQLKYSTNSIEELNELIERAASCYQVIEYRCNNSRLLSRDSSMDRPYGWWVGRTFQPMYYWGGAAPGSNRCYCGLTQDGCSGKGRICNCDSATSTSDSGQLVHREYLPVMAVYFGDTGTTSDDKVGFHRVGKLVCQGDKLLDNVITFRKADATIRLATFEAEPSGDIWFQFKTTAMDGVMLHNVGSTDQGANDFIQVKLINGDTVQFHVNSGSGVRVLEYKATNALNNNEWHTVHIERNRKQAWLRVDNFPEQVMNSGEEEVTRTLDLTGYLFVGATVEDKSGFVGCMRGLRVNGVLQDLYGLVERGDYFYGVSTGCVGKCDSNPCFNGGTCKEGYSGYTCDCAYTPWRGWMCGREVGVNLKSNYQIKYTFDENQGLSATDFKNIRVGFTTYQKTGILLQLRDATNKEYVSLEMNNMGGIRFVVDVGFERWEMNTENEDIDYANGQQHEVKMWREGDEGRHVKLQVDNYAIASDIIGAVRSDSILDNPKYLIIGNNETKYANDSGSVSETNKAVKGFEGCIYRVQIDNIFPLKRAFQDPPPSFILLSPAGEIREDMCGFEEITQKPDEIETRPYEGGPYMNITFPYSDQGLTTGERAAVGAVVAIVFLIIIVLAALAFFYFRQKGDYETKEAKGQSFADNPDTAVVFNQTGVPDIAKRKEWFL